MASVASEMNSPQLIKENIVEEGNSEHQEVDTTPATKPKQRRRYQCYQYSGEQLQLALQKCREGLSIRECSKRFGVPKSTLWDKLSSRTPPEMTRKGRSVVTRDVENRLVNWILRMNESGFDVNETQVKEAVKVFLDKSSNMLEKKHNRPGKAWYKNFLLRHPILYYVQNDDVKRTQCSDEKLQHWYEESLDTEVPTFVSTPVETAVITENEQPSISSTKQMKSAMEYIELTVGPNTTKYFKHCKDGNVANEDPMYKAWLTLASHLYQNQVCNESSQPTSHSNKRKRKPKHYMNYLEESSASTENQRESVATMQDTAGVSNNGRENSNAIVERQPEKKSPLKSLQESEEKETRSCESNVGSLFSSEISMPLDPHKSLLQKSANLIPPKNSLLPTKL